VKLFADSLDKTGKKCNNALAIKKHSAEASGIALRPEGEETLENPKQLGAEGARLF
jgi:hypothetical protein